MDNEIVNALSVDLEEWYQAFAVVDYAQLKKYPRRVASNLSRILSILREFNAHATFFVLGQVAEELPDLVLEVAQDGHEIATHGYSHRKVYDMSRDEFQSELRRSIDILEGLTGQKMLGYRAPWFSITNRSLWALNILVQFGLKYDASIFSGANGVYGIPGSIDVIHRIATPSGEIFEFPPCSFGMGDFRLGFGGGFYLRSLPYQLNRWAIRRQNRRGFAAMTYVHPWEFDKKQPRLTVSIFERFIHYYGLEKTEMRFRKLLTDFEFASVRDVLGL